MGSPPLELETLIKETTFQNTPIIDRFFLIGGSKSKISEYKLKNTVTLEPLCAFITDPNLFLTSPNYAKSADPVKYKKAWDSISKEAEIILKFAEPFGINLKHERIGTQLTLLNQILLRDDSSSGKTEFFCIAINPPEEEEDLNESSESQKKENRETITKEMRGVLENSQDQTDAGNTNHLLSHSNSYNNGESGSEYGLGRERLKIRHTIEETEFKLQDRTLKTANPNNFNYYFFLKYNDTMILPSSSGVSLDVFHIPKLFVFRSKFPLSIFFHDLLNKLLSKLRKIQITHFMKACVQPRLSIEKLSLNKIHNSQFLTPDKYKSSLTIESNEANDSSLYPTINGQNPKSNPEDLAVKSAVAALNSNELCFNVLSEIDMICKLTLSSNPIFLPDSIIEVKTVNLSTVYRVPPALNCSLLEAEFGYKNFLSNIPFEEFVIIFMSLLFEKTIVLVSENAHSLSAGMATINALIKPFRWCFPQVYSLPAECLLMLESPVPLQIALRMNSKTFLSEVAPIHMPDLKNNSQMLILLLDEGFTVASKQLINSLSLPFFHDFLIVLQVLYKKDFRPKPSSYFKISKKKSKGLRKYSLSRSSNYSYNDKLSKIKKGYTKKKVDIKNLQRSQILYKDKNVTELFESLQGSFRKHIVNKLPAIKDKSDLSSSQTFMGELKVEQFSSNIFDQVFLKQFFATQAFHFYFENDYMK